MTRPSPFRRLTAITAVAAVALTLAACTPAAEPAGDYVTDGKLTIGTGEPAYYPWVLDDAPESGEGFEAAIAYAVAEELGFAAEDVVWVRTTFDEAIAPGPKNFDFNLQQYSITDERRENVDFSSAYYETTQVVITTEGTAAAGAASIADLKDLLIGAATGTTSFDAIEQQIAPTQGARRSPPTTTPSSPSSRAPSTRSSSTCRPRSTSPGSSSRVDSSWASCPSPTARAATSSVSCSPRTPR